MKNVEKNACLKFNFDFNTVYNILKPLPLCDRDFYIVLVSES